MRAFSCCASMSDTLIVIPNQNLFRIANERTTFAEAFVLADQVLYSGVACIVELVLKEGLDQPRFRRRQNRCVEREARP